MALLAEDVTGIGNEIGRQLLRTRRSFTATVLSADGLQVGGSLLGASSKSCNVYASFY